MGEIELLLAANGGVASAVQLREMGWSHRQVKKQGWQPLRRGWYATPSADPQVGDGHLGPVTTSAVAKVRQLRSSDPIPSPPRSNRQGHRRQAGRLRQTREPSTCRGGPQPS